MTTADEMTVESIEREFPGWHAWKGVSGLWYAQVKHASPQILVRGEDPVDLRDSIVRWIRTH